MSEELKQELLVDYVGVAKVAEYHINLEIKNSYKDIEEILKESGLKPSSYLVYSTRGYSMQHSVRLKTKEALKKLPLIEDKLLTIGQAIEVVSKSMYYPVVKKLLQSKKLI